MKTLKNRTFLIVLLAFSVSFFSTSCDELTENTKQTINFSADDMHFSIDSVIFTQNKAAQENIVVFDDVINLGQALDETDYSMNDVQNIAVTEVTLLVREPQGLDLTLFEGTTFHLGDNATLVAEISSVDAGAQSVTFNIIDGDFLNYINDDDTVRVVVMMDENTQMPTETVDVTLQTSYQADVEIL